MDLAEAIEKIALDFPSYGYRRITAELHRQGLKVNHKRVLSLMRDNNLLCRAVRAFKATTDSSHGLKKYPNLIAIQNRSAVACRHYLYKDCHIICIPCSTY
ncbi:MAG: IS3 family transposase [Actinomycetota bacterium]|nr:IS3 family transposase [Actinomycetota bacterium]